LTQDVTLLSADTPSTFWSVVRHSHEFSRKASASRFNIDTFCQPVGTQDGAANATKFYWLDSNERKHFAQFDTGLINIHPSEVKVMNPQQSLLR